MPPPPVAAATAAAAAPAFRRSISSCITCFLALLSRSFVRKRSWSHSCVTAFNLRCEASSCFRRDEISALASSLSRSAAFSFLVVALSFWVANVAASWILAVAAAAANVVSAISRSAAMSEPLFLAFPFALGVDAAPCRISAIVAVPPAPKPLLFEPQAGLPSPLPTVDAPGTDCASDAETPSTCTMTAGVPATLDALLFAVLAATDVAADIRSSYRCAARSAAGVPVPAL